MKGKKFTDIIRKSISNNKMIFAVLILAVAGNIITGVLPPLVLERIVNRLTLKRSVTLNIVLFYVALIAISNIFESIKEILITVFGQKVTHQTRSTMAEKMTVLPAAYYVKNGVGTVTSRVVNDVNTVEALFTSGIISMFTDVCKVISILVIIFVKSRGLGILMLIVTPILYLLTRHIQKKMFKAQLDNRRAVSDSNNHIPDTIKNIRMIHSTRCEEFMKTKYLKTIDRSYDAMEKSNYYDAVYSPIIITLSAVIIAIMMICAAMGGGVRVFFGMSVGTAVAVISYVDKVFAPLESIGMEIQNIQSAIAGISRVNEFVQEKEIPKADMTQLDSKAPAIEISHLYFGYEENEEIIHDYSLLVHEKENVTLTGRTGIGKSTLFKLILGLYEPWKGEVKLYGVPVSQIKQEIRSSVVGYVEQAFHPIEGNVYEQITLKNKNITKDAVKTAIELVGMTSVIEDLEEGYETMYSKAAFSQGQIQLLSIARAIVNNPRILLLDEITANMDSSTEKQVLDALEKASKNRTVISISHRTVSDDNRICLGK